MTQGSVHVLALNSGSSSLKAAVYEMGSVETRVLSLTATRLGLPGSRVRITDRNGATLLDQPQPLPNHEAALESVLQWLDHERSPALPDVVGHRVVHGGGRHWAPEMVTPELLASLEALERVDPDHMPQTVAAIRAVGRAYPGIRQVACFDTGFHSGLPPVARRYALPPALADAGVVRYGFHGLSYEYVMQELRALEGPAADGRIIIAHLGSGASIAAIRGGRSVETTMGFSPTGGLVMGTRCGDLDPSVVLYLIRELGMSPPAVSALLNRQSGLLGVSTLSADMHDLLEAEASDSRAAEAIALFCYRARQYVGAAVAVLGGLDVLVFTGGIGEHAAPVRERIGGGLGFLNVDLDVERNRRHDPVISSGRSGVTVRVIRTNEELMVARHASRLAA